MTVYEKTSEFARFGGPIQFASNALSVLKEIDDRLFDRVMEKFTFTGIRTCGIKDGKNTKKKERDVSPNNPRRKDIEGWFLSLLFFVLNNSIMPISYLTEIRKRDTQRLTPACYLNLIYAIFSF